MFQPFHVADRKISLFDRSRGRDVDKIVRKFAVMHREHTTTDGASSPGSKADSAVEPDAFAAQVSAFNNKYENMRVEMMKMIEPVLKKR